MENDKTKNATLTHGSLFSGIGGFDLAAEWMGWENVFHCEYNPFCQRVLKHHFKKSISYGNIKTTDFSVHRGRIDILTGGFPCQPYSTAGKRLGKDDDRHLFPEMLRAIKEIQPRWIIGENVRGLVGWNGGMVFHEVYDDLESQGYEVESFLIPAASVNAPHQRYRVWFVAYAQGKGTRKQPSTHREWQNRRFDNNGEAWDVANTHAARTQEQHVLSKSTEQKSFSGTSFERRDFSRFPSKSPICGGNDGIPRELDAISFRTWRNESIKAYGNAIVPQVAFQIYKTIQTIENNF